MHVGFAGTGNMGVPMAANILKAGHTMTVYDRRPEAALTNQAVLCEAMALADRLGIPRDTVADVLGRSSGGSFILERKRAALAARDYRAGFFVDLALKDLRLALRWRSGPALARPSRAKPGGSTARRAGRGSLLEP